MAMVYQRTLSSHMILAWHTFHRHCCLTSCTVVGTGIGLSMHFAKVARELPDCINFFPCSKSFIMSASTSSKCLSDAAKPRKRFVGSNSSKPSKSGVQSGISNQIPQDILHDAQLNAAIKQLPSNYSFEIHKTIHHIRKNNATMVALQTPEGLQMFICTIADIIERCAENILQAKTAY